MPAKYKKRADGRYLTQITVGIKEDGRPKYKNIYAKTIRELEEKAAAFKQELEKGIIVDDDGLTVAAWARKWLEVYKHGREYNTMESYNGTINTHIIPALGHYKLRDLKAHHIQEMINERAAAGLTRTLELITGALNQMLKQAIKNEYIYKNAAADIVLPKIDKPKKRSLTEQEKAQVTSADLDDKAKAFVFMLLYTGVRRGEALALTTNDIDLENKTIEINKNLIFVGNRPVIKNSPKTDAGNRIIPIPDVLYNLLIKYLPTLQNIFIFPSAKNVPMSESAFRRFWEKIIIILNLPADDITPHIFRHTYATTLYYAGIDVKTAQYLLGHASIRITLDIYTHLEAENNSESAKKLNSYINKIAQ